MASPTGQGGEGSELARLREEIDDLDTRIRDLLQQRTGLAQRIAPLKQAAGLPPHDPQRERDVITKVLRDAGDGLDDDELTEIFQCVMRVTRGHIGRHRDGPSRA